MPGFHKGDKKIEFLAYESLNEVISLINKIKISCWIYNKNLSKNRKFKFKEKDSKHINENYLYDVKYEKIGETEDAKRATVKLEYCIWFTSC